MEQANKTQVIQEAKLFNELWALLKKYYNVTLDTEDEVWEQIIEEGNKIAGIQCPYKLKKYKQEDKSLSVILTLDILEYLESMAKSRGHIADIKA